MRTSPLPILRPQTLLVDVSAVPSEAEAVRVGAMTGRRIQTQAEADALNAEAERMGYNVDGKPLRFVVSTPESEWAEFCELWPRVAKWARVVPNPLEYDRNGQHGQ